MNIVALKLGVLSTNAYLVVDGPQASLIDPAGNCELVMDTLKSEGVILESIYLTHGHADHIAAAMEIKRLTGAKIFGHGDDQYLLSDTENEVAIYLGLQEAVALDETLQPGGTVSMAGVPFAVLSTPGHTPGSCCFYSRSEKLLFTGDTLFAQSIGRTDLPGGDYDTLKDSLAGLKGLPDDTKVLPGHGPSTTIGQERVRNRYW